MSAEKMAELRLVGVPTTDTSFGVGETGAFYFDGLNLGGYEVAQGEGNERIIKFDSTDIKISGKEEYANGRLEDEAGNTLLFFHLTKSEISDIWINFTIRFDVRNNQKRFPLNLCSTPRAIFDDTSSDMLTIEAWELPYGLGSERVKQGTLEIINSATHHIGSTPGQLMDANNSQNEEIRIFLSEIYQKKNLIGLKINIKDIGIISSAAYSLLKLKNVECSFNLEFNINKNYWIRYTEPKRKELNINDLLSDDYFLMYPKIELNNNKAYYIQPYLVPKNAVNGRNHSINHRQFIPLNQFDEIKKCKIEIFNWKYQYVEPIEMHENSPHSTNLIKSVYSAQLQNAHLNRDYVLTLHRGLTCDVTILFDFGAYKPLIAVAENRSTNSIEFYGCDGHDAQVSDRRSSPIFIPAGNSDEIPEAPERTELTLFDAQMPRHLAIHEPEQDDDKNYYELRIHGFKKRVFGALEHIATGASSEVHTRDILTTQFIQWITTHLDLENILKSFENSDSVSISFAIAHPGYINQRCYSTMITAAEAALEAALAQIKITTILGPIRGFSEPVAVGVGFLKNAGSSKNKEVQPGDILVCVDIGHQTFDVAVLEVIGNDGSRPVPDQLPSPEIKLIGFGSANAGAAYIDAAINEALADGLVADVAQQFEEKIRAVLPGSEAELRRACDRRTASDSDDEKTIYGRMQYMVEKIDEAKRGQNRSPRKDGNDSLEIEIANNWPKPSRFERLLEPNELRVLASDPRVSSQQHGLNIWACDRTEKLIASLPLTYVKATQGYKNCVKAATDTLHDVAEFAEIQARDATYVLIAGRGGQTPLFNSIKEEIAKYLGNPNENVIEYPADDAKKAVLRGASRLAQDHSPLLADLEPPFCVVAFNYNGEIIDIKQLTEDNAEFTPIPGTFEIAVIDRGHRSLRTFQEATEDQKSYFEEAFFLHEPLHSNKRYRLTPGGDPIILEKSSHVARVNEGEDKIAGTFVSQVLACSKSKQPLYKWEFCSPGTVNQ